MNSWIVAGLIAGVVAYLVDWVLWTKVSPPAWTRLLSR